MNTIFETLGITQGWDGTIKGSPAQIGGYAYAVKYRNPLGAVREKGNGDVGEVMLISDLRFLIRFGSLGLELKTSASSFG